MIAIQNVNKKFKRRIVLDNISLNFEQGVYGLLGANGAGKTTLMRCMLGLYNINGGSISFDGYDCKNKNTLCEHTGYLPQKFGLFKELSVFDMLSYFVNIKKIPKNKQKQAIEESLEMVNLSDRSHERIGRLSGGMVRRVGIAQALLGDPAVMIFDEPTSGLDPEERMRFKSLISTLSKNKTIIISTHIVEDVEATCDHVVVMHVGKILADTTTDGMREFARGKVYEVRFKEKANLCGNFFIEKTTETEDCAILRVLSAQTQPGDVAKPTIEDGYMARIKEI